MNSAQPVILAGFDGSEHSFDALVLAHAFAATLGQPLVVGCVMPWHSLAGRLSAEEQRPLRERAERKFALARPLAGEAVFVVEPWHSPAGALYSLAERHSASMVVIGSTHRGALARAPSGASASGCFRPRPAPSSSRRAVSPISA